MIEVRRLAHATFSTPDIGRMIDYWTNVIGLVVTDRTPEHAYLSTRMGHEAIALVKGEAGVLQRLAFQVAPGTKHDDLIANLSENGVSAQKATDISPNVTNAVTFEDPKGTTIEVFDSHSFSDISADVHGHAISPVKFGHLAYRVNDPQKLTKFYCDLLGFRVSDWIGDHFSFLRCSPDHHTINFAQYEKEKLHHMAFEVSDIIALNRACDYLAQKSIPLVWGPIRHIVGHNVAAYHMNPDRQRVELFCEMDLMFDEELGYFEPRPWHEDRPQRPKVWPADTWRAQWGFGSFGVTYE